MRQIILLFFLLVTLVPASPSSAQEEFDRRDGCDASVRMAIAGTTDILDYNAACAHYRLCDPQGLGDTVCQMKTLQFMLDECSTDDAVCRNGAILFAAAMLAYKPPINELPMTDYPLASVANNIPKALEAYWQGDYPAALVAYSQTGVEDYRYDAMLPLSRAIIYQLLDQPDEALAEYAIILAYPNDHPLAWYARSQYYGELGRVAEAAFDVDALRVALYDEIELQPLVESLQAQYPLPATIEDWFLFPVTSQSNGVSGRYLSDLSLNEPYLVKVGIFPEQNALVTYGVRYQRNRDEISEAQWPITVLYSDNSLDYTLQYPEYLESGGNLSITVDGDVLYGMERLHFFEGGAEFNFILSTTDEVDPREPLPDTRYCEQGVLSRVEIGMQYESVSYADGLAIADEPGGEIILRLPYDDSHMTVIDGPICIDNVAWWQVTQTDEAMGWVAENRRSSYMIRPSTPH